jgi:peptidoglycan/xylan/chitin deacetylase (PgdA/CDA1 family)
MPHIKDLFRETHKRSVRPVKRLIGMSFTGALLRPLIVSRRVWVLAFHRVDDLGVPDPLTCGTAEFEAYCRLFSERFEVIKLSEQLDRLGRSTAGGTLSITFDDGYLDNYEKAAPILERLGLPATFFLATGFIGSDEVAWWDRDLPKRPRWMTWDQARELRDRGFEIGCHTVTHADLGSVSVETAEREIREAKERLAAELGQTVDLFAYPYGGQGNMNPRNREVVKAAGMRCNLSCYGGANAIDTDPFSLCRVPINSAGGESPQDIAYHLVRNLAPLDPLVVHIDRET